jgi:hypothetical protein
MKRHHVACNTRPHKAVTQGIGGDDAILEGNHQTIIDFAVRSGKEACSVNDLVGIHPHEDLVVANKGLGLSLGRVGALIFPRDHQLRSGQEDQDENKQPSVPAETHRRPRVVRGLVRYPNPR